MDRDTSEKIANFSLLCACMVVAQHLLCDFAQNSFWGFVSSTVFNGVCQIAVPYFFVVSGYFLAGHFGDCGWYGNQVNKRLKSIMIPFLVWNFVFFIFLACLSIGADRCFPGRNFLHLFTLHHVLRIFGVDFCSKPFLISTWYLRSLLILVVASPLLKWFVPRYGLWSIAFFYFLNLISPPDFTSPASITVFFTYSMSLTGLLYFSCGIYLCLSRRKWNISFWRGIFFVGVGILVLLLKYGLQLKYGFSRFSVYMSLVYIPMLLMGVWRLFPIRIGLLPFAKDSFGLYLVHMFLIVCYGVMVRHRVETAGTMMGQLIFVYGGSFMMVRGLRRMCPRFTSFALGGR